MAGMLDRLYWASPLWLQQVGVAAWGVVWYARRHGGHFHRLAAELREHESWEVAQFLTYQEERLARVLAAAWNTPYYAEVFRQLGLRRGMDPWDALRRLPVLSKDTFRRRKKDILVAGRLPRGVTVFNTSGTTGTPLGIYYTRQFHALQTAVAEVRSLNVGGATHRSRRFMCGGRKVCAFDQQSPPFWRASPIERLVYGSSYHLSPAFLRHYVDLLRRFRPEVVMGYPSALGTIAHYALTHGQDLPPATMAVTTAETLSDQQRRSIEEAWHCRLFDRYGAIENCVFAGQCEFGRYHVSPEIGIVEILRKDGRPCDPGEIGEVVCTGLHNVIQPLIRYRLGDAACWAQDQACACGRNMPILERIEGRLDDMLYTADGRRVGRVDHIFKGVDNVVEAQVVQDRIDAFTVRLVPGPGFGELEAGRIRANLRTHVGDVAIRVQTLASLERSPSGKFRAVLCKLDEIERRRATASARAA